METTHTITLQQTTGQNGRNYYVLNDGQFFADVETGLVYAADDHNCENSLGGWDGSATFVPWPQQCEMAVGGKSEVSRPGNFARQQARRQLKNKT